MISELAVNKA